jgi:hypothetical protein
MGRGSVGGFGKGFGALIELGGWGAEGGAEAEVVEELNEWRVGGGMLGLVGGALFLGWESGGEGGFGWVRVDIVRFETCWRFGSGLDVGG